MSKRTAVSAEAGAAAPASVAPTKSAAPAVQVWPPDQYTGIGGTYIRDPITGVRTPVKPEATAKDETPQPQ